ncbi:unnamed protein product [Agarophyton chilense]
MADDRCCGPPHERFRIVIPSAAQADFSCGDWWLRARCCNGTEAIPLVTSVYYTCSCQPDGMTSRGLAVILVLAFAAISVVLAAVAYVLYRQKKRAKAEEEEHDRAIEEAQVYLPR